MTDLLRDIVMRNRAGEPVAIPSVCSAHAGVLRASMIAARQRGASIVIEATSNQVNQDGGYTGMTPADFVTFATNLAAEARLPVDQMVLGGDHLGPQAWRFLPPDEAMAKAHVLVTDYARAGFTKIHLDCSEGCAGEDAQLPDHITAARSAALAVSALKAAPDPSRLGFVIGTEVPPPGGARLDEAGDIPATTADAMQITLQAHKDAFEAVEVDFAQVYGLVVQPGVEFSPMQVHAYPKSRVLPYQPVLADWSGICLEAHSTDFQDADVYPLLAAQGFAFQKVGPALTFAWRQALYALDWIAQEMGRAEPSLRFAMEDVMTANPGYWQSHYHGSSASQHLARHYGYADRIRYYWPDPNAQRAIAELDAWIAANPPPSPVLTQGFSAEILAAANRFDGTLMTRLASAQTSAALVPYFMSVEENR